ncbi:MAG: hypothetical protein Kow00124_15990 [Anaerolineae bacterium]
MSTIILFIIGLLAFLFGFGFLINRLMRRLNGRVPRRLYSLIEWVIISGILLGIVGMFQPWVLWGFRVGFNLLLVSTLLYIVWSHIIPRSILEEENARIAAAAALIGEGKEP